MSRENRYWTKVDRSGGPHACWPWLGHIQKNGYGGVTFLRVRQHAHRVALRIADGSPPDGKPWALHHCDNRACCNPLHLYWGNSQDNVDDCKSRNRHWWPAKAGIRTRLKDMTGRRFSRIVVLGLSHTTKNDGAFWECRCDCGEVVVKRGRHLRSGGVKSCGCLRRRKPTSHAPAKRHVPPPQGEPTAMV